MRAKVSNKRFPRWERIEPVPRSRNYTEHHCTEWALFSSPIDAMGVVERMSGHWRYEAKGHKTASVGGELIVGFEPKRNAAMAKVEEIVGVFIPKATGVGNKELKIVNCQLKDPSFNSQ